MTWLIEDVFSSSLSYWLEEIQAQGHRVIQWNDDMWRTQCFRSMNPAVFRGSLENAVRHHEEKTGVHVWCDPNAFDCHVWYPHVGSFLIHNQWTLITACQLLEHPEWMIQTYGDSFFVRPNSPLKFFSGRVLHKDQIGWEALDFGYYFEDRNLPIIVAPVQNILQEWRFVVVNKKVVAGSSYTSNRRQPGVPLDPKKEGNVWHFASSVAEMMISPAPIFVMDVCEISLQRVSNPSLVCSEFRVLELNPFGGADLYACPIVDIVQAVSRFVGEG